MSSLSAIKMSLKTIISSALASAIMATAPYATADETPAVLESFDQEGLIDNPVESCGLEPSIELPELTKRYHSYWLSEKEFEHVGSHVKSGMLSRYQRSSYLGFIALMRHKPLIDFMACYYGLDSRQVLDVINQETAFSIRARGKSGERGIGQNMKRSAKVLVDNLSNPGHELYYPYLDREDYSFEKLSSDYRLNIITTAAMIRTAHSDMEQILAKRDMTREELAQAVKAIGQEDTFWHLRKRKSTAYWYYIVGSRAKKRINNFWKENDADLIDLDYLVYNGGKDCVTNLLRRRVISEVLQFNFYSYSKKKKDLDYFLSLYSGSSEDRE